MSYNLQSLITILQQILNPEQTRRVLNHNKPQLESLLEKAASLQEILDKSSLPRIENLESQIRDATHKAEDIIETGMVDRMLSTSLIPWYKNIAFPTPDLHQVMQELDSAMEQVLKLVKGKPILTSSSSSGAPFLPESSFKSIVVGVDEELMQLKERLTGMQRKLEIIPIVGMGGIGKTTIALKLYQDPQIASCFKARAWATILQDYNMQAILQNLLHCIIGKEFDQDIGKASDELKDMLYQRLYGRRYLIVLDDIWSTQAWDDLRRYFPDNNNGSRLVLTTRESNVAKYADAQSLQHQVQLLSKSVSWDLLRQIVFGEEDCPYPLQDMGEKIASDCGGLPLAINVVGGLLSKVERSIDIWENVGNDIRGAIVEPGNKFSNILSLSYNHLPNHLKPLSWKIMGFKPPD